MKFMLTFDWSPDAKQRAEGIARFRKIGGRLPKGVKLLGRWTEASFGGGYVLLETDDARSLTEFALAWNDLMELYVVPVLEDSELSEVLKRK
jgi:Domain of unknown function (DUF3303)